MEIKVPSPQTTLLILLGASKWPQFSEFQSSKAFANAVRELKVYFLKAFGLPAENVLDLFDSDKSADGLDVEMSQFLERRLLDMKKAGNPARDLLLYFVGHGGFVGNNADFYLAIRRTRIDNPRSSGLQVLSLADMLTKHARFLRRIIVLDCCFAAAAFSAFEAGPDQVAIEKTKEAFQVGHKTAGFPAKGTTLLCSSSHKTPSLLRPDGSSTMFTKAFLDALVHGLPSPREYLTLRDVKDLAANLLTETRNAPRPVVLSPDQSEGDVADIPFFPNPRAQEEQARQAKEEKRRLAEEAAPSQAPAITSLPLPSTLRRPKHLRSLFVVGVIILLILILLGGGSIGVYNVVTGHLPWSAPPGQTWHVQKFAPSASLTSVAWSGSQLVAVGYYGIILTSPNGSTWTAQAQASGTSQSLTDVVWSGSQFVAVGQGGAILASPNGRTWTPPTSGTTQNLTGVAWSGSQFVAVSSDISGLPNVSYTSPNGSDWKGWYSGTTQNLTGVAWSGSQFVAVGEGGTILTSPNGSGWTTQTSGTSQNLTGVAWSGSQLVAVGYYGTILTSPNGNTWTAQASGTSQSLTGVAWSGSQFVAVGEGGTILTSPNGNTWTAQTSGTSQSLTDVVWSGSQLVAVGNNIILTSP